MMASMNIVLHFVDLCLFKSGPEDLPASQSVLKITLLVYLIVSVLVGLTNTDWMISIWTGLTETIFMMLVLWLILQFRGGQARYVQTLTAMAGSQIILGLISIPILWQFYQLEEIEQPKSLAMMLIMIVLFWSLMVTAHIFRKSLDIIPSRAVVITVIYSIVSLLAVGLVMSAVV